MRIRIPQSVIDDIDLLSEEDIITSIEENRISALDEILTEFIDKPSFKTCFKKFFKLKTIDNIEDARDYYRSLKDAKTLCFEDLMKLTKIKRINYESHSSLSKVKELINKNKDSGYDINCEIYTEVDKYIKILDSLESLKSKCS